MEASLKAKELLLRHYEKVSGVPVNTISHLVQFFNADSHWKTAKECALITVDELIYQFEKSDSMYATNFLSHYWGQVKNEINNFK